jgi:hypothetical protein
MSTSTTNGQGQGQGRGPGRGRGRGRGPGRGRGRGRGRGDTAGRSDAGRGNAATSTSRRQVNPYPGVAVSESALAFTYGWEIIHDGKCDFAADNARGAYSIDDFEDVLNAQLSTSFVTLTERIMGETALFARVGIRSEHPCSCARFVRSICV